MEVIIWDNGSTDGTQKEVGRIFVEMEKEGLVCTVWMKNKHLCSAARYILNNALKAKPQTDEAYSKFSI